VILTLPALGSTIEGMLVMACVCAAHNLRVKANTGDTIDWGQTTSKAAGYIESAETFSYVCLRATRTGSSTYTWTVQEHKGRWAMQVTMNSIDCTLPFGAYWDDFHLGEDIPLLNVRGAFSGTGNSTLDANKIRGGLVRIPRKLTLATLKARVNTLEAAKNFRFSIYLRESFSSFRLVYASGDVSTGTTGDKSVSPAIVLYEGDYFVGLHSDSAVVQFQGYTGAVGRGIVHASWAGLNNGSQFPFYSFEPHTYGSGAPSTLAANDITDNRAPEIWGVFS
jgi:hypothetical protein